MFVLSVKATKRRLIFTALCVSAIVAVLIASLCFPAERTMMTGAVPLVGDSDEACATYLRSLGYDVDIPADEVREIRLPDEFDTELSAYNALQKQAGFDLSDYAGARIKLRTYTLLDHVSGQPTVAHIYLYNNLIIGGDIEAVSGDFLEPLYKATALPQ